MQLSKNLKTISQHFAEFGLSTTNFKDFGKNNDPHSVCSFQLTHCEKHRYTNVEIRPCHSTLLRSTCQTVQNTCEISMRLVL